MHSVISWSGFMRASFGYVLLSLSTIACSQFSIFDNSSQSLNSTLKERPTTSSNQWLHYIDLPNAQGSTHEFTFAADGSLWITQQLADRIVLVNPATQQIETIDLDPGSKPHGIVSTGSNAWVALEGKSELLLIDAQKNIKKRLTLAQGLDPHGLFLDQQSRLWYTGKTTDVVGWVNVDSGESKIYPLEKGSKPIYVSVSADGTAWFTELEGSKIGRIRNDQVEVAAIPTPNARPIAIKAGPDGSIWFTEEAGRKLGKINAQDLAQPLATSLIEEISVDTAGTLAGLDILSDGTIWFQANGPDQLIRYKNKQFNTFPLGTSNVVQHRITQSPDGKLWSTELKMDRLVYFDPADAKLDLLSCEANPGQSGCSQAEGEASCSWTCGAAQAAEPGKSDTSHQH